MKTETIELLVKFKIEYDNKKLREEAIQRAIKEVPFELISCGADGSYRIKQIGAAMPNV